MPNEKSTSSSGGSFAEGSRNDILKEHQAKFPEGDPSVRRISPEKGSTGTAGKDSMKK